MTYVSNNERTVKTDAAELRNKAARDEHRKAILSAYRVIRHGESAPIGKVTGVYGDMATATKVAVAWGDAADNAHVSVLAQSSDEYIENLAVAP